MLIGYIKAMHSALPLLGLSRPEENLGLAHLERRSAPVLRAENSLADLEARVSSLCQVTRAQAATRGDCKLQP